MRSGGPDTDLQTKRAGDFADRSESRIPFAGQSLVKTFTTDSCFTRKLTHIFGSSYNTQRMKYELRVVTRLLNTSLKILLDILIIFQVIG